MMMRLREPERTGDLPALGAFTFYLALSIPFFGRALFGHLSDFYFGIGVDPGLMMWSLVWWPHALANGLNPLLTKAIWAPSGFNFAWEPASRSRASWPVRLRSRWDPSQLTTFFVS